MNKVLRQAGINEDYFHSGEMIMNYVAGPDNGPPLVFIPGQSVTWEEYTLLLPLLADKFQVYAVSQRGHGDSSWTPGLYTVNQLGRDMAAFLERVVGRQAFVAGNSLGGVVAAWLAANSPDLVKGVILEDPPLFRCDWPNIKGTSVYDMFQAMGRMAVPGGGGLPRFFLMAGNSGRSAGDVMDMKMPPQWLLKFVAWTIAVHQAMWPNSPIDLKFLPMQARIVIKGISQFDGNFARAFAEGASGKDFDHAETLAHIRQPVLFLHANWHMGEDGRLTGALDDDDVARAKSLVKGPWKYVRMNCGHAVALDAPDREAEEILSWFAEQAN